MSSQGHFDVGINDYRGIGKWLPQDPEVTRKWLDKLVVHVDEHPRDFQPVIKEFQQLIEGDPVLTYLFTTMFTQIPNKQPYMNNPEGQPQVRDYMHMLELLNHTITRPPPWSDVGSQIGLVGVPMNAILDWPMGTISGIAAFGRPDVNAVIKKVLDTWGAFLKSPESVTHLNSEPDGWLSPYALNSLTRKAADGNEPVPFEQTYNCDPSAPHYGFTSWDDFFTRTYREGVRPIESPDDDSVIANACESAPYRLANNVAAEANFWIKEQPYSLTKMLAGDPHTADFVGGTVYQAFLSAQSYHRWHAPVSGKIVSIRTIPGTYFMEDLLEGFANPAGPDTAGPELSQGFITCIATRMLIIIEADNKDIGLVAFLPIGMVEVSSCEATVKPGQHVKKGDDIGTFHFGGSTSCLIFQPGLELKWTDKALQPFQHKMNNIPVRSKLATVVKGRSAK
jgi:phosphatidylserine decarboxylase